LRLSEQTIEIAAISRTQGFDLLGCEGLNAKGINFSVHELLLEKLKKDRSAREKK
jgi:hypothetical protein